MVPTVLDVLDIEPPKSIRGVTQSPIEGVSFTETFKDAEARSKHRTQYFEMIGHRSLYHDGWRAVCPWPGPSFTESGKRFGEPISAEKLTELDAHGWELYHVEEDWAENHNVAAENRPKLIEMIATWYVEAGKYNVLPVDGRGTQRFAEERPQVAPERTSYTYYPHTQAVPANVAAQILNRPHRIIAEVDIPSGSAEGVLLSHGSATGGYTFYVQDDRLHYAYNYLGRQIYHVKSSESIRQGRHRLRYEFEVTGKPDLGNGKGTPGIGRLYIDSKQVGQIDMPVTIPLLLGLGGGLVCGSDPGDSVIPDYQPPFRFTGQIHTVIVELSGETIRDREAEIKVAMVRQ
jgi:arylsulfatase